MTHLHGYPSMISCLLLEVVEDIFHVNLTILTTFLFPPFQYPKINSLDYLKKNNNAKGGRTYSNNSAMRHLYTPRYPSRLGSF